ncbi:ABC transporter substrate-binding protein [Arthrobacter glacialis]|uniref:Sulfonate ABC transporter substrate-binding protein n=1 Tax=Arthrobacter glacialis TaxID=1664 RepID=A0A2S3ZZF3_ARTGL|nr:ABC transporter substrate-binding protein [Arthrobacter glacialis]POH57311.1 sulfonate ABC transporter substrate-binding protein [Arthrobacter glacialis]POH74277.1 sulfonate ABC transporter substrate-binding protein [Arthrobacter glacialis]
MTANQGPSSPENGHLETTRIVAGQKPKRKFRRVEFIAGAVLVVLIGAGATVVSINNTNKTPAAPVPVKAATLKLGYFPNVTHAPAIVGLQEGLFAKSLDGTALTTQVFNAGPAAIEALSAGAIDAAYIGPNPAINSYVKSQGESVRIIAGATSGGAQLVVKPEITSPAQLKGKVLATPQLGGTQDVALRSWLVDQGFKTTPGGGGDVIINPTDNAQTLKLFQDGKLDGAWLPEPWASRLVLEAGAKVLVNEADLWDKGEFSTTILIVNKKFLAEHPQTVTSLLEGHVASVNWLNDNKTQAAEVINAGLTKTAGKPLAQNVIDRSLTELTFNVDPLAGTFPTLLDHGVKAGVTKEADISGIFDLGPINAVLKTAGKAAVSAAGLGSE